MTNKYEWHSFNLVKIHIHQHQTTRKISCQPQIHWQHINARLPFPSGTFQCGRVYCGKKRSHDCVSFTMGIPSLIRQNIHGQSDTWWYLLKVGEILQQCFTVIATKHLATLHQHHPHIKSITNVNNVCLITVILIQSRSHLQIWYSLISWGIFIMKPLSSSQMSVLFTEGLSPILMSLTLCTEPSLHLSSSIP